MPRRNELDKLTYNEKVDGFKKALAEVKSIKLNSQNSMVTLLRSMNDIGKSEIPVATGISVVEDTVINSPEIINTDAGFMFANDLIGLHDIEMTQLKIIDKTLKDIMRLGYNDLKFRRKLVDIMGVL